MLSKKEIAFVFASIVIMALILNIVTMDAFVSSLISSFLFLLKKSRRAFLM